MLLRVGFEHWQAGSPRLVNCLACGLIFDGAHADPKNVWSGAHRAIVTRVAIFRAYHPPPTAGTGTKTNGWIASEKKAYRKQTVASAPPEMPSRAQRSPADSPLIVGARYRQIAYLEARWRVRDSDQGESC